MTQSAPWMTFLGLDETASVEPRVRILPLPYDLTTSYRPGARGGPLAMLEASTHVECFDEELDLDLEAIAFETLAPVEPDTRGPEWMAARVLEVAAEVVDRRSLVIAVGGEHSLTPPLVAAHRKHHEGLSVLQIDAHADLRSSFGDSPDNHACAMRRVLDEGAPIVQVGIRALSREERELIRGDDRVVTLFAHEIVEYPASAWIDRVLEGLGERVYVTVDVDGFDPAIMPSTGTPEPGGLSWRQVVDLLAAVSSARSIVGADVMELAPIPGMVAPDFMVARLVARIAGLVARSRGWV